jgi:flavorubredoxin
MRRLIAFPFVLLVCAVGAISTVVELEADPRNEILAEGNIPGRNALIIMHPSWLDGFQEELTAAFAMSLAAKGWRVERMRARSDQIPELAAFQLIVIGTNTYYWRPDLPTKRVLAQLNLESKRVVGIVSGAGSTDWAVASLRQLIVESHGEVLEVRPYWLWRPNDET